MLTIDQMTMHSVKCVAGSFFFVLVQSHCSHRASPAVTGRCFGEEALKTRCMIPAQCVNKVKCLAAKTDRYLNTKPELKKRLNIGLTFLRLHRC